MESDREERAENNSLVWDHSHQSFLFGLESENCHSTPTIAGPLSNSNLQKESNKKTVRKLNINFARFIDLFIHFVIPKRKTASEFH